MDPIQESPEIESLLERISQGDRSAYDPLLSIHRSRLRKMVDLRMADGLRGRIDASDVVQEALVEASQRLPAYLEERKLPFFIWLRFLTRQKLFTLHRHHIGTQARDPRREISLQRPQFPEASTEALAAKLIGQMTSPSQELMQAEMQIKLLEALNILETPEREIIAIRHFEQLSNSEAARELDLTEAAASKRYIRALARLKGILESHGLDMSVLSGGK